MAYLVFSKRITTEKVVVLTQVNSSILIPFSILGYSEQIPYDSNSIRSVYHVREFEVFKLQHYTQRIDIFLSHDWPRGIYKFGDTMQLLQKKPFFAQEVSSIT